MNAYDQWRTRYFDATDPMLPHLLAFEASRAAWDAALQAVLMGVRELELPRLEMEEVVDMAMALRSTR